MILGQYSRDLKVGAIQFILFFRKSGKVIQFGFQFSSRLTIDDSRLFCHSLSSIKKGRSGKEQPFFVVVI